MPSFLFAQLYGAMGQSEGLGLSFHAPMSSGLTLLGGLGTYSFERPEAAPASTINDFEDKVWYTEAEEARPSGVRRVQNLIPTKSEDLRDDFVEFANATIDSATSVTMGNGDYIEALVDPTIPFCASCELAISFIASGSGDLLVQSRSLGGVLWAGESSETITLTSEPVRYCVKPVGQVVTDALRLQFRNTSCTLTEIQIERIIGQAIKEPSEYVSVGVGTAPGHREIVLSDWTGQLVIDEDGYFKLKYNNGTGGTQYFEVQLIDSSQIPIPGLTDGNVLNQNKYAKMSLIGHAVSSAATGYFDYGPVGSPAFSIAVGADKDYSIFERLDPASGHVRMFFALNEADEELWIIKSSLKTEGVEHGSNIDGVKYFDYWNLNYVTNYVVIDNGIGTTFGRRVENLLSITEDLTHSDVIKSFCTTTPDTVTFEANANSRITFSGPAPAAVVGRTYANRVKMWVDSGTHSVRMYVGGQILGTAELVVTTTPTIFGGIEVATTATLMQIKNYTDAVLGTVHMTDFQSEDVTNQTNQAPSEYVSKGVDTFPFSGTGIDGVAEFAVTNPNTVTLNVVTPDATTYPVTPGDGVLIEGARTNLISSSEDFNGGWNEKNVAVTLNDSISPVGVTSADKINETAVTDVLQIRFGITISPVTDYTFSCYLKEAENRYAYLTIGDFAAIDSAGAVFDLQTGSITTAGATTGSGFTISNSTIQKEKFGFYRCSVTCQSALDVSIFPTVGLCEANQVILDSYLGTVGNGIHAWGAQCEETSFASSYIPTFGASVARGDDLLEYDAVNYSDEMTIVGEFTLDRDGDVAGIDQVIYSFDDSSSTAVQSARVNVEGYFSAVKSDGVGSIYSEEGTTVVTAGTHKFAVRYSENTIGESLAYLDGNRVNAIPSLDEPDLIAGIDTFSIGVRENITYFYSNVENLKLYNKLLTVEQLERLSQVEST